MLSVSYFCLGDVLEVEGGRRLVVAAVWDCV